jgi:hypothetical protein
MNKDHVFQGDIAGAETCPRCGRQFVCGARAGERGCWCTALPALEAFDREATACYCPDCLAELIAQRDRRA